MDLEVNNIFIESLGRMKNQKGKLNQRKVKTNIQEENIDYTKYGQVRKKEKSKKKKQIQGARDCQAKQMMTLEERKTTKDSILYDIV